MNRDELIRRIEKEQLPELEYRAKAYWDEEDQRKANLTDLEYVIREAEWIVEDYTEDTGHVMHDEWINAKALLKETCNGRRRPLDISTLRIKEGYRDEDIQRAKDIVDEVKRTKAFIRKMKRLQAKEES